ncbi:MAG TPA: YIP1 family protein [Candidatus Kapabacteria bacterium]|nr:YIP1 family protein [Candidatus Kapabacteria bacterium]
MNQDDQSEHLPSPTEESSSEPPRLTVPFEDPSKEFIAGLLETMKLVLFQPTHFFKNYRMDGPIGRPVLFAVMIGWTTAIISAIWGTIVNKSIFNYFQEHMPEIEGIDWEKLTAGGGSADFALTLILAPVFILIGLFIIAGIYHLFLTLVKGANKNFETTFNVVSYGMVSRIAEIIPVCGSGIAWIFGLALAIIGLAEAHKTTSGKAAFAVLVPILLCCLCIFVIFMIVGVSGLAALLNKNFQ